MHGQDAAAITACLDETQSLNSDLTDCGLERLIKIKDLSSDTRALLRGVIDAGFTLRSSLPAIDNQLLTEWIGQRWYLAHRTQLANMSAWTGLVASRISRTDPDYCSWPLWLEKAVRSLSRDNKTLVLAPGTTIAAIAQPLVHANNLSSLRVRWPNHARKTASASPVSTGRWLLDALSQIAADKSVACATLFLSSPYVAALPAFERLPIADRLLIALSHQLIALSVRPEGNTEWLLSQRLRDKRFPLGTVAYRMPSTNGAADRQWLDRQAIGWYLPLGTRPMQTATQTSCQLRCHTWPSERPVAQWTVNAKLLTQGDYLIHCVRGGDDDAFRRGDSAAIVEAIARGNLSLASPYETLLKIIEQRRLRASGKLLRTGVAAVSFTSLGLQELMARRRYQSHLGRWDWEPYGLMIQRQELERLGARPVLYGDEELFKQMDSVDRHYFQPARRRSARCENEHWRAEQEWRLLDDLRLSLLSPASIMLFVETASQAQTLAMHYPWPVIWLQANQIHRSLNVAARGRRSSARTNRN